MSNVSTAHTIVPFVSGETKPLSGQRLARVICKQTAKMTEAGIKALPSVAASIPQIDPSPILTDADLLRRLLPYIGNMLESAQDGIIRSLYESSQGALSQVLDSEISLDACIAFLGAEAEGDRLTKESLIAWFDTHAREACAAIVAEKFGFLADADAWSQNQKDRVAQGCTAYRDIFASLSGGKTQLEDKKINGLRIALDLVDETQIAGKLRARLDSMARKNAENQALANALFD